MPLISKTFESQLDSFSVLNNVLQGKTAALSCPEFSDIANGCNGLGGVFGYKYKDAVGNKTGSLDLWLWLPDPS